MKNLDLSTFSGVVKSDWENLAKNQLKGKDPNEVLSWQPFKNFSLNPYYDSSDIKELEGQLDFFQKLPNHVWKLYEEVKVYDEKDANEKAISALMGGCNGIVFNLTKSVNIDELLKGINSEICDLSFIDTSDNQFSTPDQFYGMTNNNCHFETIQYTSPITQLSELIVDFDKQFICRTAFSDFFLEIATVRALRYLLNHELQMPESKIHSKVKTHAENDHQLFLNTSAGLASILGGSHSISLCEGEGGERISRNIGNLIREESGIAEYQDQCGGSYYVEALTKSLIEETLKEVKL